MSARLPNDCFALPPGVDWTPVDVALERLRAAMRPVVGVETVPLALADGRFAAADHIARRAHPARDNAAVDGVAYRHPGAAAGGTDLSLRLAPGAAAAGAPWRGRLAEGDAVRIFTGAAMPDGADSVALSEDLEESDGVVRFAAAKRPGANRRRAGENLAVGDVALRAGARIGPPHLAQLASAGLSEATVHAPLKVAILSTGDELADPGDAAPADAVIDANAPMLSALVRRFGMNVARVDRAPDDRAAVERALDAAAEAADAILVSGGASSSDADHVSAALSAHADGGFHLWRIAMKPGRPLALGLWRGVPVFGLPGNPVAAFVCTLILARPALFRLAGGAWPEPRPARLRAAFASPKKAGRREYLRVRVGEDGRLEKYRSEGSGLVDGLIWSDGLADLPHADGPTAPDAEMDFLSWASLGIAP